MPNFKIIDVFEQDCHLIVRAEHYHADGSFWFLENYRWQGREGLKRKRKTNAQGQILMDNGLVAPVTVDDSGAELAYLPEGRDWARYSTPHLDESSIVGTITSIHQQRLLIEWPQIKVDIQGPTNPDNLTQQDRDGCPQLTEKFAYLKGKLL